MKRKKYYGVAGSNGYGVYDNYNRVLKSRPFITAFTVKKFKDFDEAKVFALDEYDRLQDGALGSYEIEEINEKNWFYRRELIDKSTRLREDMSDTRTDVKNRIRPFMIGV